MEPPWLRDVRCASDTLLTAEASPADQKASADRLFEKLADCVGLDDYESGPTVPAPLAIEPLPRAGETLRTVYELEPRPGIRITPVRSSA